VSPLLLLTTLLASEVANASHIPARHRRTERDGRVPLAVTPVHVKPSKGNKGTRAKRKAEKAARSRS
jgi:hypothetical protein